MVMLLIAFAMVAGMVVQLVNRAPLSEVRAIEARNVSKNRVEAVTVGDRRDAAFQMGFVHGVGLVFFGLAFLWVGLTLGGRLFSDDEAIWASMAGSAAMVLIGLMLLFLVLEKVWIPLTDGVREALGFMMVDHRGWKSSRRGGSALQSGRMVGAMCSLGALWLWASLTSDPVDKGRDVSRGR